MKKTLDIKQFDHLIQKASSSTRKRSHRLYHNSFSEPVQRLSIGLICGTYIKPHKHTHKNRWEMVLALKGCVIVMIFNEDGTISDRLELSPNGKICGLELSPNVFHTVFPVTETAVIMEIKEGPYKAGEDIEFAKWAPEEGSEEAVTFLNWANSALISEKFNINYETNH